MIPPMDRVGSRVKEQRFTEFLEMKRERSR
jgi:hypothetical protein